MPRLSTGYIEWSGDPSHPRPTDHWRVRVTMPDGSRPRFDLAPGVTAAKARKKAAEMAALAKVGKLVAATSTTTATSSGKPGEALDAWVERWFAARATRGLSSVRADGGRYRTWIAPVLGGLPVAALQRQDIERWVEWIDAQVRAEKLSWKTAFNAWGLVSKMFGDSCKSKVLALRVRSDNPTHDVAPPDRGVRRAKAYLWPSEVALLLSCAKIDVAVRRCYALAVYLLPRSGELEALAWEDVDLLQGTVHFHRSFDYDTQSIKETKGNLPRRFTIEPNALPLLRVMRAETRTEGRVFAQLPVWKNQAGELRTNLRLAGVTRADLFADDATRKQMTFHDLRATGITWMAIRGDEPLKIKHRAGHSTLATTEGYIREGENVGAGFGEVFPPLPKDLLGTPQKAHEEPTPPRAHSQIVKKPRQFRFGARDSNPYGSVSRRSER